ncbi:hypothetical protein CCU_07190 [Coprococcus sp. ART55/1]|nr:hypothetical protein CCU_07190 [Coprococcus sp. ART55/1]
MDLIMMTIQINKLEVI